MTTPHTLFADLDDAMTRLTALFGMVTNSDDPGQNFDLLSDQMGVQIRRAVDAHARLTSGSEAIPEIKAFLLVTYGGQPG